MTAIDTIPPAISQDSEPKSVMTRAECPPFHGAFAQLQEFIAKQGLSPDLLWIFRQDVVRLRRQTYIKVPVPNNEPLAESLYNSGRPNGLGIHLSVFCLLRGRPCCYVWLPSDSTDAEYRMLSGLKLSVPVEQDVATPVRSRLRWKWLKWCESRVCYSSRADDLPFRAEGPATTSLSKGYRE